MRALIASFSALFSVALFTTPVQAETAPDIVNLAAFLGIDSAEFDSVDSTLGGVASRVGSAIKQTVSVAAGDTVRFDWSMFTNEPINEGPFLDYTFFSSSPVGGGPDTLFVLENAGAVEAFSDAPAGNPFLYSNAEGFITYDHTFTAGGVYEIGVGVVQVNDTNIQSGLLVDNWRFDNGNTGSVGNPGFESAPDFTNWSLYGGPSDEYVIADSGFGLGPFEGAQQAFIVNGVESGATVPEPTTLALFGLAGVGAWFGRRRRSA